MAILLRYQAVIAPFAVADDLHLAVASSTVATACRPAVYFAQRVTSCTVPSLKVGADERSAASSPGLSDHVIGGTTSIRCDPRVVGFGPRRADGDPVAERMRNSSDSALEPHAALVRHGAGRLRSSRLGRIGRVHPPADRVRDVRQSPSSS